MTSNQNHKYVIALLITSHLIIGFLLHGILPTICRAAVTTTITSDGTLGTQVTKIGRVYNIDGGTIKGSNLFQSFGLFSVGTGDTASFNGPNGIANILGRVTGGQQSMIDGFLRSTIKGANLYLLNPAGVLFGQNATLDVSGSFHVSTADFVRLGSDGIFYANLSSDSVLTTAPPSAFGFLNDNPGAISIQESTLLVPEGKNISVIGGDIIITNDLTGSLVAPSGQINLVSVASSGEVNLSNLNTNSFTKLGNITISQAADGAGFYVEGSNYDVDPAGSIIIRGGNLVFKNGWIAARGNPGGVVNISGEQLQLDNTSINTGTRDAANHPGNAVDINVTGDILFTNGSEIASSSFNAGRAGDVRITASNIQLGDDDTANSLHANIGFYGDIGSRAFGSGRGGDVYITADSLTVKNGFFINTAAVYPGSGNAGNVTVRADSLKLLDGGSISSNGLWIGTGGVVDVVARDVLISSKNVAGVPNCPGCFSGLAAQTGYGSKGGLLKLSADNLQILDGGQISTTLFSVGPGADLEINAKNILISGVVIDNRISPPDIHAGIDCRLIGAYASGTGGNISIITDCLEVTSGGSIDSSLYDNASGNAGNISIQTKSLEVSEKGGIFASALYGRGNAGSLEITAEDVRIIGAKSAPDPFGKDFTGLSTSTNVGRGGDLLLTVDSLFLTDRGLITSGTGGLGQSGNITINSASVKLLNGSGIVASAFGPGAGGNIEVKSDSLLISGVHPEPCLDLNGNSTLYPSGIASQAGVNGGSAGDIKISTSSLEVLDGARITTETFGSGDGGSIEVNSNSVLISGINKEFKKFLTEQGVDSSEADILSGASILTSTAGFFLGDAATGNAGNLRITAQNLQVRDGGLISSGTDTPGDSGNIEFTVDSMELSGRAKVSAESSGAGFTGSINIKADTLQMKGSSITTEAIYTDGGNIQINAGELVYLLDSEITASVGQGLGKGGNITIDPEFVVLNDSKIIANAYGGPGGNIRIVADLFLTDPYSIVDASSALGISGTVDINAPISSVTGILNPLSTDFISATALLREQCIARLRGGKYSSFIVVGRDGLPIEPGNLLPGILY